jgi:nitrate/nitrite transport system substrate-binding protein
MSVFIESRGLGGTYSLTQPLYCACGGTHPPDDHWQYQAEMPQDPLEWIDDLIKMGHYSADTLQRAEQATHAAFREALVQQMIAAAPLEQQQVCHDLMAQAGGLSAAFSAAFGPNASEFFTDTIRSSQFRRRDFLTKVAATAAIITLASCAQNAAPPTTESSPTASPTGGKVEKTDLTIGFIPIACSIPIVLAEPKEIYKKYGLNVKLKKMPNWAAVRESAIAGELDAYHMLSPMPIAMTLGLGSTAFPVKLASIENINGQSIALALKHKDNVKSAADFKGLTIAIPFPFSMHNLLLRYYLATAGLDPDKDLTIQIVPPPDAVAKLAAGQIDGFLMPDNFGQRVVFEKVGFIHLLTKDLWPGHPCCSFAASQTWIDTNPNTFRAVNKAIIESAAYVNAKANRAEAAQLMAERKYLNQPEAVLKAVLTGQFENGLGETLDVPDRIQYDPYPWKSFAKWIAAEMVRWQLMPEEKANYADIADTVYMTDLARELAKELGQTPPTASTRTEKLKFGDFDPAKVEEYVKSPLKPKET